MRLLGVLIGGCLILSACGASDHTVKWYTNHPDDAAAKAAKCKNDAAKKISGDCQNAIEAVAKTAAVGNGKDYDFPDITPDLSSSNKKNANGD